MDEGLQGEIENFYEVNYWDKIQGDNIKDQDVAESIFDFGVNAGPKTSAKLAQLSVNAKPDGIIGPKTLEKLNTEDKKTFLALLSSTIQKYTTMQCKNAPLRNTHLAEISNNPASRFCFNL